MQRPLCAKGSGSPDPALGRGASGLHWLGLGDPGSPGYSGGRPAAGKRKTVKKERRKGKAS